MLSRRQFGRLALASVPAAVLGETGFFKTYAQAKPNSLIEGVQIGTITYSYRSMPEESAEATLKYIVDSGISAIELMGGPVESFAGAPAGPGRGGNPDAGGRGRGGRGREGGAPQIPDGAKMGSWNGQPCVLPDGRGAGGGGGRRGAGRGEMTPEQQAQQTAQQEYQAKLKAWRSTVSR